MNFEFKKIDGVDAYALERCSTYDTTIVVPETYQGLPVVEIEREAFGVSCMLASKIVLPN